MPNSEILAYLVIGLAVFLVVGGVLFLVVLSACEKLSNWRVERASRKGTALKPPEVRVKHLEPSPFIPIRRAFTEPR